jgi:putative sigma-54 modulation protein
MQIEIRNRHFNLADEQKEKIAQRLEKLARFSPRPPVSSRLTITHESGRFTADLAFFLKNTDFRAKGEDLDPERVADEVIENIKTQLRRYKDKITGRPKGEEGGLGRAAQQVNEGLLSAEDASPKRQGFQLKNLSVEDAMGIFRQSDNPFFVFRNSETAQVNVLYERDDGELGLLHPLAE